MNAKERAEKIVQHIESIYGKRTGWVIDFVEAQIEEAEREAVEERINWEYGREAKDRVMKSSYTEGFNAAREKAKGIAEKHYATCDKNEVFCVKHVAKDIGEMEP